MADANLTAPDYLASLLKRFLFVSDAESQPRRNQLDDYKFSLGDDLNKWQWSAADQGLRGSRPMLTTNRINQYIKRLGNTIRAEMPDGRVIPVDSVDDPELAEDLEGLLRYIKNNSDADIAHATATDQMLRMGVSYWRILPERTGSSANQELRIKRIRNRFTVYMDPTAQDPAGADARYVFIVEDLDRDEYKSRYPTSEVAAALKIGNSIGDMPPLWMPNGGVRIAECFERVAVSDLPAGEVPDGYAQVDAVRWCVINGLEILDGNENKTGPRTYPIPWIPVPRAIGEESEIDGQVDYSGVTRGGRSSQKMSNYEDSSTAEMIALSSKSPWLVDPKSIENYKDQWETANTKNWSYLPFDRYDKQGRDLGAPIRNVAEPPIQAMAIMGQRSTNNLRAVMGEVDADAQETRPEQSGKAILLRQRQGETGNSHFRSNLGRSLRHEDRILLAWIPYIYDVPRQLRIQGRDEQQKTILIHAGNAASVPQNLGPDVKVYDLANLKFDVVITEGPAFQTKRQETVEFLGNLITSAPEAMIPLALDLMMENSDTPVGRQVAERARKQFGHDKDDQAKGQPPIPPQVQQQMQQLAQQHDLLVKELNAKNAYIESEQAKLDSEEKRKAAELTSKERIAQAEIASRERIAAAELASQQRIATMKLEQDVLGHSADLLQADTTQRRTLAAQTDSQRRDLAYDADKTGAQHDHELEVGARQMAHETEMQPEVAE